MMRNKAFWNGFFVMTVVVAAAVVVSACGRNWCVAGLGPCEMFEKLDSSAKPKPYDPNNPCQWTSSGAPQNGLTFRAVNAPSPVRVGQEVELYASGGPKGGPYTPYVRNNMGTFTPLDAVDTAGARAWKFRATTAGFACVKVLDQGMSIDTPCDTCWLPIYIAPAIIRR